MRTNLSGLPVPDLVAELVIAHAKPGLHKVYDQHAYRDEKRRALDLMGREAAFDRRTRRERQRRFHFLEGGAMNRGNKRAALVEQIIDVVAPTRERKAECATQLETDVALVQRVARNSAAFPTSKKKIRRDVDRLALTLKKARAIARQLPALILPHILFDEGFATKLDAVIDWAEECARDIVVGDGHKDLDTVKWVVKLRADALVKDFSSNASRGCEGRKNEIASLLYEIVTKRKDVDLSDYRVNDDQQFARLPRLVLRRKFAG